MSGWLGTRVSCALAPVLLFTLALTAANAGAADFKPYGSVKLEYETESEKKGDETIDTTTITQKYGLQFDGYIWRRDFLTFQTLFRYDDSIEDDSDAGKSRERDMDLYQITANLFPERPTPLTLYTRRNMILSDSEEAADTETQEDTYRLKWLILFERLPEMSFEFERILETTDDSEVDGKTVDRRDDSFKFTATEIYGVTQLRFEYQREADLDALQDNEDTRDTFILTGTSQVKSNLKVNARVEYDKEQLESADVVTSLAVREDIDAVAAVTFYDGNINDIRDDIAVPLTTTAAPDFTGWVPSSWSTTFDVENNNQITFSDAPPNDVVVVIEYATEDSHEYFDIYVGDGNAKTFPLTVTKVILATTTDNFMVFADYFAVTGATVTLDFSGVTTPKPVASGPFPITDVDVTIAYNTKSGNHFEDEFPNGDIKQTGTIFDLTRVSPKSGEEILFETEVNYLPIPPLDLTFRYEFDGRDEDQQTTTEHFVKVKGKYTFSSGLINTTEVSYDNDTTEVVNLPDLVGNTEVQDSEKLEWDFLNQVLYTRPLSWATLVADYKLEYDTRDEKSVRTTDTITNTLNLDLLMGQTRVTNKIEYETEDSGDQVTGEDSSKKELSYLLKMVNSRTYQGISLGTTLEYKYELDMKTGEDDLSRSTYTIEEKATYKALILDTSLEYEDEVQGDKFSKELESDSEIRYRPYRWLELKSGLDWILTQNETEEGAETTYFVEGTSRYSFARAATSEFIARQEWILDELGEDEQTLDLTGRASYIFAKTKFSLEAKYEATDFGGESEDTEDITVKLTMERRF